MHKQASYVSVATAITLVAAAVSGGMYVGALADDVEELEKAQETAQEDHDRLVTVENEVKHIKKDVDEVKADVKSILQAVQRIENGSE
jgi:wobble nucleotide-excising tRNase